MNLKICTGCNKEMGEEKFYKINKNSEVRVSKCKECTAAKFFEELL